MPTPHTPPHPTPGHTNSSSRRVCGSGGGPGAPHGAAVMLSPVDAGHGPHGPHGVHGPHGPHPHPPWAPAGLDDMTQKACDIEFSSALTTGEYQSVLVGDGRVQVFMIPRR
ncbi:putative uncharacterized protein DDB_G0291608 [Eriocheir sinensis]|uniref:putative uncharacterized protein DDB_G0291608 n=1 Tax=Eriocheir sinensis TaxID=95602 RepID=UPI0021C8407C|nr:putative uncharacterized protein DDB_G0291608 [Eriocheir sinensis]